MSQLDVVKLLRKKPMTIKEMAKECGFTQSSLNTSCLKLLKAKEVRRKMIIVEKLRRRPSGIFRARAKAYLYKLVE